MSRPRVHSTNEYLEAISPRFQYQECVLVALVCTNDGKKEVLLDWGRYSFTLYLPTTKSYEHGRNDVAAARCCAVRESSVRV